MERMKTRMEKYARYRKKILDTPDDKFENKKTRKVSISKEEKCEETPYTVYRNNEIKLYVIQGGLFLLAIIVFVLLYIFWVRS